MKIVLRGGHSPKCKGAIGFIDEQRCVRNIAKRVHELLKGQGHTVYLVESNESSVSADLAKGVNKANEVGADLFFSIHMNASNGEGNGSEVWAYRDNSENRRVANAFCENYKKLGFKPRGLKTSNSLYELKHTKCTAYIFETLFCDNEKDFELWNKNTLEDLAFGIANAIDPNIGKKKTKYRVLCYGMTDESRAKEAIELLKKGNFNCSYESYVD